MAPWCLLESHINRDRASAHRYYTKHALSLPRRGSKRYGASEADALTVLESALSFRVPYCRTIITEFSLSFKAQIFFFFLTLSGDMTDSRAQIRLWPIYVLLSFFFSDSCLFFVSFVTNLILYQPGVSFNTWLFLFHLFLVTISKMWNQLFFKACERKVAD